MRHAHAADHPGDHPGDHPTDRPVTGSRTTDPVSDPAPGASTTADAGATPADGPVAHPRGDVRTFGGEALTAPALLATLAWQSVPSRSAGT